MGSYIDDYKEGSDDSNTEYKFTNQEDHDSINSEETNTFKDREMNEIVVPKYVRFQQMILLDNKADNKRSNDAAYKDNYERIRIF